MEQYKGICCQSVSKDIFQNANFKVISELRSPEAEPLG